MTRRILNTKEIIEKLILKKDIAKPFIELGYKTLDDTLKVPLGAATILLTSDKKKELSNYLYNIIYHLLNTNRSVLYVGSASKVNALLNSVYNIEFNSKYGNKKINKLKTEYSHDSITYSIENGHFHIFQLKNFIDFIKSIKSSNAHYDCIIIDSINDIKDIYEASYIMDRSTVYKQDILNLFKELASELDTTIIMTDDNFIQDDNNNSNDPNHITISYEKIVDVFINVFTEDNPNKLCYPEMNIYYKIISNKLCVDSSDALDKAIEIEYIGPVLKEVE